MVFRRRRVVGHEPELGVVTPDGHFRENVQHALVGVVRKLYGAELVKELDTPDDGAADVGLAGDGAYDVPRGDVVSAAYCQVVAEVAFFDAVGAFLAFLAGFFRSVEVALAAVAMVADLGSGKGFHLGEQGLPFLGKAQGCGSYFFDVGAQFHRHFHEGLAELGKVCVC